MSIFGFAEKFLVSHGSILLFHDDNFWVLREIKSYLEMYMFKIQSKFYVVNSLKHTNLEFKEKKITFFLQPYILCCKYSILTFCIYVLAQTLFSKATFIISTNGTFKFSTNPQNSKNLGSCIEEEDLIFNLNIVDNMTLSKTSLPFRVGHEIHLFTICFVLSNLTS